MTGKTENQTSNEAATVRDHPPVDAGIIAPEQQKEPIMNDRGFWRMLYNKAADVLSLSKGAEIDSPFFVWKDAGTGNYWWFAIYSNNYQDNDNPPEIIAAEAHRNFVKQVDDGVWPMPELWLWHVPGTRVGAAHFVGYDEDNGFAVSSGTFDADKEVVAERLMTSKGVGVSHGMPGMSIKRDADDPLTIIEYRTREISPLPMTAAANKATGFMILQKELNEMLPKEKVEFLQNVGLDAEALDSSLKTVAAMLADAGVPSKEATDESVEAEAAVEEKVEAEDVETEEEVETEAKDADVETEEVVEPEPVDETPELTQAEIVAAAVAIGVEAAMTEVTGTLKAITDRLEAVETKAEEAEDKAEDVSELTPAASFADLIRSNVIGNQATKLDGRSKEAKDTPEENKNISTGEMTTPFDIVNNLKAGRDWRAGLPS
jgi:hypothetical protein